MKAFITGGAGFIGSNLVEKLLQTGSVVTVYDNFSTGKKEFLNRFVKNKRLRIITGDVLNTPFLEKSIKDHSIVFHLSANADVRKGTIDKKLDFEQETIATFNVLEAMRKNKIKKIIFPSSMTIYGPVKNKIVSENYGPCLPISPYGAGKLASEAMISSYAHMYGIQAWILRFANIIGKRTTHGVVYDLTHKLLKNKKTLQVLGDGYQTKSYIYVDDAIEAMFFLRRNAKETVNIYNIGGNDSLSVRSIVEIIRKTMELSDLEVFYQKKPNGWVGDVPVFTLDITKSQKLGFTARYSAKEATKKTVREILQERQTYGIKKK